MTARPADVLNDQFRLGFRAQKSWGVSMATAFFFGETGAGLYFVAQFFALKHAMLAGLLMVMLGKGGGHLLHLGKPSRGWRALARVGSSWISRGLLAIVVFVACGALHLADMELHVLPAALDIVLAALAIGACLVIMVYQGFAMSHSPSITLWSTGLMPVASLTYALLNGVVLTLAFGHDALAAAGAVPMLRTIGFGLILYGLVVIFSLLHTARFGSGGGRHSVEMLVRGAMSGWFIGGVIVLGLIVSGGILLIAPGDLTTLIVLAGTELTGYYAFRVLMFKSAVYEPVLRFAPRFRP